MRLYHLEFELPVLPPMNTGATRAHRMVQHRWTQSLKKAVEVTVGRRRRPKLPLARACVTAVRCSAQQPDYENMVYSFKAIFDALVQIGVLIDDAPGVCLRVYLWEPAAPGKGHVRVTVDELAPNRLCAPAKGE